MRFAFVATLVGVTEWLEESKKRSASVSNMKPPTNEEHHTTSSFTPISNHPLL
jgi:hypothetical protein